MVDQKGIRMFVVILRFGANRSAAALHLAGHQDWIQRGLDDGLFLLVGSLQLGAGGAVLVHGLGRDELDRRIWTDPFVAEGVVTAEILEITPAGRQVDERLAFLLG
jgi:uncharacterized protein YciI